MIRLAAVGLLVAMAWAHESDYVLMGAAGEHVVTAGESWVSLGARLGVSPALLARQNGRGARTVLRAGDIIRVDSRHVAPAASDSGLVINVPQRLLFVYRDGLLAAHYPIAVGLHDWRTPIGAFAVRELEENPTWDVPVSIQEEMRREGARVLTKVPPGPSNPLGRHWIGLTLPGVGIHGTNVPSSIYRSTTHGCIRMHPDDVAALFTQLAVGDTGLTVYEPILVAVTPDQRLFLEVHPDIYRRVPRPLNAALDLIAREGFGDRVDRAAVARIVGAREGIATEIPLARK